MRNFLLSLIMAGSLAVTAQARTITLDLDNCDLMATISSFGPGFGWMGTQVAANMYDLTQYAAASNQAAILIRFNLDSIPANQRVVRAELVLPIGGAGDHHARLYIWKLLQPWGAGASYLNRMVRPQRVAWNQPGARGPGVDRALEPSANMLLTFETGEVSFNVTDDVDLWHSDGSKNYGWMICTEAPEFVYLVVPLTPKAWKLRVTYEPNAQQP